MKNTISLTKHVIEASGTIQELDVSVSEGWLSNYFLDIYRYLNLSVMSYRSNVNFVFKKKASHYFSSNKMP